jgi:urease alpha subunit
MMAFQSRFLRSASDISYLWLLCRMTHAADSKVTARVLEVTSRTYKRAGKFKRRATALAGKLTGKRQKREHPNYRLLRRTAFSICRSSLETAK